MKSKNMLRVAIGSFVSLSLTANSAINGYFDAIHYGLVDDAYGWICDSSNPNTAPPGNLVWYSGGPAGGGGTIWQENSVSFYWGFYRPDVPAAGYCGSNQYAGFGAHDWIPSTVYLYYRDTSGNLTLINGSPKICSGKRSN